MLCCSVPPGVLVDVAQKVHEAGMGMYLSTLELESEDLSLVMVVPVIATGVTIEEQGKWFEQTAFGIGAYAKQQVQVVMQQAVGISFCYWRDMGFVKPQKETAGLLITKEGSAVAGTVIYMVCTPGL